MDPYKGSGLRMGDGVRELDEASEGDGVMEPSSEPRADRVSWSDISSIAPGGCRREERVLTTEALEDGSAGGGRRAGRAALVTRCLGARGGLFAAG